MAKATRKNKRYANLRARAAEILSRDGNRLTLIWALVVCLLFVALYTMLGYCMAALSLLCDPAILVVFYVIAVYLVARLIVVPTLLGLFYIASRMTRGEETVVADLFHFLGTRSLYRYALRVTRPTVYLLVAVILCVVLTVAVFTAFVPFALLWLFVCALTVAVEIVGFALLLCRFYPMAAVAGRGEFAKAEFKQELRHVCPHPARRGLRFFVSFLGWLLLGLLTVGLLWIADTLPRMLVAYSLDCTPDQTQ